jgi:hypothetical protein
MWLLFPLIIFIGLFLGPFGILLLCIPLGALFLEFAKESRPRDAR